MHRWLSVAKVGGVVAQTVTQWASSVWAVASILGRLGLAGVSGLVCLRSGFLQVWRGGVSDPVPGVSPGGAGAGDVGSRFPSVVPFGPDQLCP